MTEYKFLRAGYVEENFKNHNFEICSTCHEKYRVSDADTRGDMAKKFFNGCWLCPQGHDRCGREVK